MNERQDSNAALGQFNRPSGIISVVVLFYATLCLLGINDMRNIYREDSNTFFVLPIIDVMNWPCGGRDKPYLVFGKPGVDVYCSFRNTVKKYS